MKKQAVHIFNEAHETHEGIIDVYNRKPSCLSVISSKESELHRTMTSFHAFFVIIVQGKRKRGRQIKVWIDNIAEWTGRILPRSRLMTARGGDSWCKVTEVSLPRLRKEFTESFIHS